ncbi:MAG: ABC transporter permease [Pyrinomonadaceae bacterium]
MTHQHINTGWPQLLAVRLRSVRRDWTLTAGIAIISACYLVAIFADFIAPYPYASQSRREPFAPPARLGRCPPSEVAGFLPRLCLYKQTLIDPLARRYGEDARAAPQSLTLFPRGYSYKLLGLISVERHLFGVEAAASGEPARLYLLGADRLGRDRFSRLIVAARFSLLTGPMGTLLAGALGIIIGCVAGSAGGAADAALMRLADVLMALPTLVIVLAVRTAFPLELPPSRAVLLLVSIFALLGWAEMARLARSMVLVLGEREFVVAAKGLGLSRTRILFRHILPNAARPLIVQASLMFPAFLLAETALSFLGVGLQEPEPSWGNMLAEATDLAQLRRSTFTLLAPAAAILLVTLGAHLSAAALKRRGGQAVS